jgi:hypothetical protein
MIEFFGSESRVKLNFFKWSNKITIITYIIHNIGHYYLIITKARSFEVKQYWLVLNQHSTPTILSRYTMICYT